MFSCRKTDQWQSFDAIRSLNCKTRNSVGACYLSQASPQSLSQRVPDASFGFVHMAVALHELKRTEEARNVLLPVLNKFRDNYMMRYNLACYSCRMGNLREASKWLEEAIDLDKTGVVRCMALEDPDLEALW